MALLLVLCAACAFAAATTILSILSWRRLGRLAGAQAMVPTKLQAICDAVHQSRDIAAAHAREAVKTADTLYEKLQSGIDGAHQDLQSSFANQMTMVTGQILQLAGAARSVDEKISGLEVESLKKALAKLAAEIQADVGAIHTSLAALDLPGVKQVMASLQISTSSMVAKLHEDLAAARAAPMSGDSARILDAVQRIEVSHTQSRQLAIVTAAIKERIAHEKAKPDKYPVDQRFQSVLQRAKRRMLADCVTEPVAAELERMVTEEIRRFS